MAPSGYGTTIETYARGDASGRWQGVAVHRCAAIWAHRLSGKRGAAKGIAALWSRPAGSGARRISAPDAPASACEGAAVGSTGAARRGKHLCGREPVESENPSGTSGSKADSNTSERVVPSTTGHSAGGGSAA